MFPTLNGVPALAHKMTNRFQIYIWERSEATLDGRVHWGLKLVLKFLKRVLTVFTGKVTAKVSRAGSLDARLARIQPDFLPSSRTTFIFSIFLNCLWGRSWK